MTRYLLNQLAKQQRKTLLCNIVLFMFALLLGSCGRPLAIGKVDPTLSPATPLPTSLSKIIAPEPTAPVETTPLNLPLQLAYIPGAAGDGGPIACGFGVTGRRLASSLNTRVSDLNNGHPFLVASLDEVTYGGWITICYPNVRPGLVQERVLGPDGTVVATLDFMIATDDQMYSHDFISLPTDPLGQYQVVAGTVDGELRTSFRVTDRPLEDVLSWHFPVLRAIGRSTDPFIQRTADLQFLYFARFEANEAIKLHFYAACAVPAGTWQERGTKRFVFSFSTRITVDQQGRIFWRLPPNIQQMLDIRRGYMIVAQAAHTRRDPHWGGPGDAASQNPYVTANFVTTHEAVEGAVNSTLPKCPPLA